MSFNDTDSAIQEKPKILEKEVNIYWDCIISASEIAEYFQLPYVPIETLPKESIMLPSLLFSGFQIYNGSKFFPLKKYASNGNSEALVRELEEVVKDLENKGHITNNHINIFVPDFSLKNHIKYFQDNFSSIKHYKQNDYD